MFNSNFLFLFLIASSAYSSKLVPAKNVVDKSTIQGNIITLEDGNPNNKSMWTFLGPKNDELGVKYINTDELRKQVVYLKSIGLNGTFIFKNKDNNYFNHNGFTSLQFKMKYKTPFVIQIYLDTNKGERYIVYSILENKKIIDDIYYHIGLGPTYSDGRWHTITRDFNEDLQYFDETLQVKTIKGISFNGEGYIDDIWLLKSAPPNILIEDGEMNGLDAWDKIGKGGKIELDIDNYLGGTIYFNSGKDNVAFRLRKVDGSYWKIKTNVVIQWKMKMKEDYKIYVIGETTVGKYIISYEGDDFEPSYNEKSGMLRIALGKKTLDDKWRVVTRDISDDIKKTLPGVDVSNVSSIIVRGHGWIDDVKLLSQMPSETNVADGWDVFDDDPDTAKIRMIMDYEKGEVVSLQGEGLRNGYRYSGKYGKLAEKDSVFIRWDMKFDERFDIMLLIDTLTTSKVIHYIPEELNYMKKENNELYIGVGKTVLDGRWHTVVRSLVDDLEKLDLKAKAKNIKAFLIRGSGYLSNIGFSKESFIIEKKETPSAVASIVLGQFDFTYNLKNLWGIKTHTKSGLYYPNGLVVDTNDNFYVVDTGNAALRMYRTVPLSNGTTSDEIILSDFLKKPYGVCISANNIYVSDVVLNKVFIFNKSVNGFSLKTELNSVSFNKPGAIFYDGVNFIVADSGNNRVLIWHQIPETGTEKPDVVLGQSGLSGIKPNRGSSKASYDTLSNPTGIFSDGKSLLIADTENNRVLYFEKIPSTYGLSADYIIGQKNRADILANAGKQCGDFGLNAPEGVFFDAEYIYISDTKNNRVLLFNRKITSNAPNAVGVLGQVNFNDNAINRGKIPSTDTLFYPTQLIVKNGVIIISDSGNNRVLVY